jgi:hypothetical protein
MTTPYTMQAVSGVDDTTDIRIALFINNELVHAPIDVIVDTFGFVRGPESVTDLNPAIFDGTTGKLIKEVTYAQFGTSLGLNLKANLASPAFTGNPTAPTAAAGDNDTSIATTAFVQGELSSRVAVSNSSVVTLNSTSHSITVPAGTKSFSIIFEGLQTNGGANTPSMRLGVGGVPEVSGYSGAASSSNTFTGFNHSTGFFIAPAWASANVLDGRFDFVNMPGTNRWVMTGKVDYTSTAATGSSHGKKTLAGVLNQFNIIPTSGSFTAGTMQAFFYAW